MTTPRLALINRSPVFCWTVPWHTAGVGDTLTIIAKATLDLVPGAPSALSAEGDPPTGDVHEEADPTRGLEHTSDFAITKRAADVVVIGHAHAPGGSASQMVASLRLGGLRDRRVLTRQVAVFGDRHWERDGSPSPPRRFDRMPLTYERAFGGAGDASNPAGTGLDRSDPHRAAPPNLEDPAHLLRGPRDRPPPACFAPLPMAWPSRWARIGTYDRAWLESRYPYFPDDFDWSFFNAAPPAQQAPLLRGDEWFVLEGMHPDHPRLEGTLTAVEPRVFGMRRSGEWSAIPLALDTVVFRPDTLKLNLVWRAVWPVPTREDQALGTLWTTVEPLGAPLALADAAARCERDRDPMARRARPASGRQSSPDGDADAIRRRLDEAGVPAVWFAPDLRLRHPLPTVAEIDAHLGATPADRDPGVHRALARLRAGARRAGELRALVVARLERDQSLAGLPLAGADLAGLDLSGRSLAGEKLAGINLRGATLRDADLTGAVLGHADLTDADLTGACLDGADLRGAILQGAVLARCKLSRAVLIGVDGRRATLDGARGATTRFAESDWSDARFADAVLTEASFIGARLERTVFDRAELTDVRLYDARGEQTSFVEADLTGARGNDASLVRARMRAVKAPRSVWDDARLDQSDWAGAVLGGACFNDAALERAVLTSCDLRGAQLRRARLVAATLSGSNLMEATLEEALLGGADLRNANLTGAEVWRANLVDARLDGALRHRTKLEATR